MLEPSRRWLLRRQEVIVKALDLLRTRPGFRRLWLGNTISQMGDWIGWVAVSVLAIHDGGMVDLALVFAAHHLPAALLAPVAGPIADRMDRRTLLVATALAQAVLTVVMAAAAMMGALVVLQLLLLLRSSVLAFFTPAERAALPRVVDKHQLLAAGAFDSGTWSVMFALGMALGGFLSALGPVLALLIDTLTFLGAMVMFLRLPPMPPASASELASDPAGIREPDRAAMSPGRSPRGSLMAGFVGDIREVFVYMWPRVRLTRAVMAKTPLALAGGAAWIVLHAVAADATSAGATAITLGLLHSVRGVGTGIGPLVGTVLVARGWDRNLLWHGLVVAGLVGMAGFTLVGHWALMAMAVLVWGMGTGTNWLFSTEEIQRCGPDRLQGRLNAFDSCAFLLAQSTSVLLTALLIDATAQVRIGAWPGIAVGLIVWLALNLRRQGVRFLPGQDAVSRRVPDAR